MAAHLVWLHSQTVAVLPLQEQREFVQEARQAAVNLSGSDDSGIHVPLSPSPLRDPAVLLFCYDRPDYLEATLDSLGSLPGLEKFSVYISQDGNDSAVEATVGRHLAALGGRAVRVEHWQRPRVPALGEFQPGHAWLAQHYKWALDRVFLERANSHVIIVEDDMIFSPDFLTYFAETAWLLEADPTLWCISSWNDNGFARGHAWDAGGLYRTSYFPGLGWMMRAELWRELGPAWPPQHWDHWMRMEPVAGGRDCVIPALSRTRNIGEHGANMDAAMFRKSLAAMAWAEQGAAPGTIASAASSITTDAYEAWIRGLLAKAEPLSADELRRGALRPPREGFPSPGAVYVVPYKLEHYARLARTLHVWSFPRGHFRFLTVVPWRGATLLLADARRCDLLPESLRVRPADGMRSIAAEPHQSCNAACGTQELVCSPADMHFVNTCQALQSFLPCPRGCLLEWGKDLPNMVVGSGAGPAPDNAGTCYITQQMPTCHGQAPGTRRLCACVPPGTKGIVIEADPARRLPRRADRARHGGWADRF